MTIRTIGTCGAVAWLGCGLLQAAPVPISGPLAGPGDGLNSLWVRVAPGFAPHTIASSKSVLGMGPGDPGYLQTSTLLIDSVDFADGPGSGGVTAAFTDDPFGPPNDPRFGVQYSGYLNIAASDSYTFSMVHDDGFELSLGGEVVSSFDSDTSPTTTAVTLSLGAGLYPIVLTGWEQGGVFINELSWARGTGGALTVPDSSVFFSRLSPAPVPEPGTWVAMGSFATLLGASWMRRARRA